MSEWISVDDAKKPDEFSLVVAIEYCEWCEPSAAVCRFIRGEFILYEDGIKAENFDGGACPMLDMTVTHWMPLPEQPEDL